MNKEKWWEVSKKPRPPRQGEWVTHGKCGTRWTGLAVAHCGDCCLTFSSASAFEKHRLREQCCDPASRGLVPVAKQYWTGWSLPGEWERPE